MGSGNIGATNVLRSGGKGLGALTFLLDVLKGCAAAWAGGWLGHLLAPGMTLREAEAVAALFVILGHMYTFWLRFKGGKGVATGFGVFLAVSPWAALAAIGVFAAVLALSRYVSLASIVGALSFLALAWLIPPGPHPAIFYAVECAVALLIVAKHHQNIHRLLSGTESRIGAKKSA